MEEAELDHYSDNGSLAATSEPLRHLQLANLTQVSESVFTVDGQDSISVDSNDTASGLIGPGRTVGLFYSFGGRKLENVLNKRERPIIHQTESLVSTGTDDTASNLIGPGRTVGLLYNFLGGNLVAVLNKRMQVLGYGPYQTRLRLEERLMLDQEGKMSPKSETRPVMRRDTSIKRLRKDFRRLLEYTQ